MKNLKIICIILSAFFGILSCGSKNQSSGTPDADDLYMLVGTYTSGGSEGIYVCRFNQETGDTEHVTGIAASNPSYLAVSEDERFVYSVGENSGKEAVANAFAFDKQTGTLKLLNMQPAGSPGPCYINTDRAGRFAVTANYGGGSVSVFPLADDGSLKPASSVFAFEGSGADTKRQKKPHLHSVIFSPDRKYLFAADLGTDRLYKFTTGDELPYLSAGTPEYFEVEPGSGPRHFDFHPSGKYLYLLNELSGKVTAFHYADGNMEAFQYIASDTTPGIGGKGSADIHVSPDGKFLYTSNRLKADGIAIFRIDETTGTLTSVGYQPTGIHPRNFIISPNGEYLLAACQDSNLIQIFSIDPHTGLLTDTGKRIADINKPVCLKFINP